MNSWRDRLAAGLMICAVMHAHAYIGYELGNTPLLMLVFHGSAALCDLALIYSLPCFVNKKLRIHMEFLCFASIVCNAIGWFLYLAYAPPIIYNYLMFFIAYLQWGRLIMADNDDADFVGQPMVFRNHSCWH